MYRQVGRARQWMEESGQRKRRDRAEGKTERREAERRHRKRNNMERRDTERRDAKKKGTERSKATLGRGAE